MTHKVHPKVYRIKEIADWKSRGFYKKPFQLLKEDFEIRRFLNKKLGRIGVEKIEIERFSGKLNIIIYSARPGLIIGRGGMGIEELKRELEQKLFKKKSSLSEGLAIKKTKTKKQGLAGIRDAFSERKQGLRIEIKEVREPWASASLSAQWIAQQIEKRVPYRRVLKQSLSKIMSHKETKGAKIQVAGRLNGAEIARREWLKEGKLPLQTIRAEIDYAEAKAFCTYGVIGVKVWIYKGEKFE